MASEELPIEASVIEAVAKAMHTLITADDEHAYPWADLTPGNRRWWLNEVEAAIREFCKATGMKVERRHIMEVKIHSDPSLGHPARDEYRLATDWMREEK